jgi:hypothetical protein
MELHKNTFNICDSSTETIKKVEAFIKKDIENGRFDFVNLIRDHQFQFNSGLSYRMLNYYTNEGMLKAKRFTDKGKRRLSFFDIISLHYLIACRLNTTKLNRTDFDQLIEVVMWDNASQSTSKTLSEFELKLLASFVTLGIQDVLTKTRDFSESRTYSRPEHNLSAAIRDKIKSFDTSNNKTNEFLTKLIFEIDRIRDVLNLQVICPENLKVLEEAPFVALMHIKNGLNSLDRLLNAPIYKRLREYSYLYKDEFGMIYGVEVIQIGKDDFIAPEDKVNFPSSFDDILKNYKNKI